MSVTCKCCKADFLEKDGVNCFVCKSNYSLVCAGLNDKDTRVLRSKSAGLNDKDTRVLRSKRNIKWTCSTCCNTDMFLQIQNLTAVITQLQKETCCNTDMFLQIQNLTAVITQLQKEISEIRGDMRPVNAAPIEPIDFDDVVHEIEQRREKKQNVIIFNVADDEKDDTAKVAEIFKFMKVDREITLNNIKTYRLGREKIVNKPKVDREITLNNIKTYRLGREKIVNKPRPIKVVLGDAMEAKLILRMSRALKNYPATRKIFISKDLKVRQIEKKNKIMKEFLERKSRGEGVFVRYIDRIPKILVSKNGA
ncbi:hypothetical protein QE152_g12556 [Popillia japonica]|uniref:Uncharacterized protein n=1 Tax=Popillia japonica TaxID=7064 RepID=A0AAW1LJ05_POPJA